MHKNIFVIIPAYNATATIESVLRRVTKTMLSKIKSFIIVDDGSIDNTSEVVKELSKKFNIHLVKHEVNKGYAMTQKTGIKIAQKKGADVVVILHADGQYAPEEMGKLIRPIENNEADVVQGSRMLAHPIKGGMPVYKFLANRILTEIENLTFHMNLAEYHSGYMIYSKKTLEKIPYEKLSDTFHFDGEMLMMANIKSLRIKEIPIPTAYGNEKSYLKSVPYGFCVLAIIIKYLFGKYHAL